MHDRRSILFGSPAWKREGELIEQIRACPSCKPNAYQVCDYHRAALDDLYDACDDPACPACT